MVISIPITYPKFKALSVILPKQLNINSCFLKIQLFQDHNLFSYIFHIFQDHMVNTIYFIHCRTIKGINN